MSIIFDYKREIDVGSQRAENDTRFLQNNFVPTVVADHVEEPKPSIFVGRKGVGKSAMRLHFENNHSDQCRVFNIQPSPEDLYAIISYCDENISGKQGFEAIVKLWEITVLINLVRICIENGVDIRSFNFSNVPDNLLLHFEACERYGIGRTLDLFKTELQSQYKINSLARELRSFLKSYILTQDVQYFVLVDSIDELLNSFNDLESRSAYFFMFFEALLTYFREFTNEERNVLSKKVFLKLFIPLDIYDQAAGRNFDQIGEYKYLVRWSTKLMNNFATSRLIYNLPNHHRRKIEQIGDENERSKAIWNAFFPTHLPSKTFSDYGTYDFKEVTSVVLILHTLKRPRDFQLIIKSLNEILGEEGSGKVDSTIIYKALNRYSLGLKRSVQKEYELVFPELPVILASIAGNAPSIPRGNLIDIVENAVGIDERRVARAMERLYEANVLGTGRGNYTSPESVTFHYDFPDFSAVANSDYFAVHRSLWHALQIIPHRSNSRV